MAEEQPTLLKAPVQQPPAAQHLQDIAHAVHRSLADGREFLAQLPNLSNERERCVWCWHLSLVTLAWDVGTVAIAAAAASPSLRAARALNRMMLEYAARSHLYIYDGAAAELHISESVAMLARAMKPLTLHSGSEPGMGDIRRIFGSQTTKATQPKTAEMLAALVASFIRDPAQHKEYIDFLESEYAIGNGYVHGSQSSFFDILDGGERRVYPRTRILSREAEVLRCINCMLALLVAIEIKYQVDLGVAAHVAAIRDLGPHDGAVSMGTHDTLMILLGIRTRNN